VLILTPPALTARASFRKFPNLSTANDCSQLTNNVVRICAVVDAYVQVDCRRTERCEWYCLAQNPLRRASAEGRQLCVAGLADRLRRDCRTRLTVERNDEAFNFFCKKPHQMKDIVTSNLHERIPQLVNTRRAAEILGRSPNTLKRWRHEGIGPDYVEIEGRISYDVSVLLEYIRRNTRVPSVRAAMEDSREAI